VRARTRAARMAGLTGARARASVGSMFSSRAPLLAVLSLSFALLACNSGGAGDTEVSGSSSSGDEGPTSTGDETSSSSSTGSSGGSTSSTTDAFVTTTGATSSDATSSTGEPDPCDLCGAEELCLQDTCVKWPEDGQQVTCTEPAPRPGETWGPCLDGVCTNGSSCEDYIDGEICPPHDACGGHDCAPVGCTGGTCYATLCFAPCLNADDCPYEGMTCAVYEKGALCLWPHAG